MANTIPLLLLIAWLLPLGSFGLILAVGPRMGKGGRWAGHVATCAIGGAFVCSLVATILWLWHHPTATPGHPCEGPHDSVVPLSGDWYSLAEFGSLRLTIGYYIDAVTLAMFSMVTLVATCIHVYSFGYMHEELEEVTDPLVLGHTGEPVVRPGRFPRFYQYLSLFCFSMLGLVVAGNMAMVFAFWELVGVCSYFLIGFYRERPSASNAAAKAFLVNRVGDFGMIIGLMALWGGLGTLSFADYETPEGVRPGIFSQVRPADNDHQLIVPDRMVRLAASDEIERCHRNASNTADAERVVAANMNQWRDAGYGYAMLVIAGLGIFCGCVGKSAQFPLHVWLPDAMEGPTPVSALIHAATMVAAGVYLAARCFPIFTPEVLLVIAVIGCFTLFMAATIALVATDIKRVLAYSTVSQLGYMMLALGCGGWAAGLFHLLTHAFFKSLLFLGSGSVIHATGTNEMPAMGGLLRKMRWTAATMLIGCLAIAGAGIPLLIGLSGFHSKDAILAQVFSFSQKSPLDGVLFWVAAAGTLLTSLYMFRLWFLTFAGKPRDEDVHAHAHESPRMMVVPLVVLAVFAVIAGWSPGSAVSLPALLEQARPSGTAEGVGGGQYLAELVMPAEHLSHESSNHRVASGVAFLGAGLGFLIALLYYGLGKLDPDRVRRMTGPVHWWLRNKWFFDEIYGLAIVVPMLAAAEVISWIDRCIIDRVVDGSARAVRAVAGVDDLIDRVFVDGTVNGIASLTHALGLKLRTVQSGRLRQYIVWLAAGTAGLVGLIGCWFFL